MTAAAAVAAARARQSEVAQRLSSLPSFTEEPAAKQTSGGGENLLWTPTGFESTRTCKSSLQEELPLLGLDRAHLPICLHACAGALSPLVYGSDSAFLGPHLDPASTVMSQQLTA